MVKNAESDGTNGCHVRKFRRKIFVDFLFFVSARQLHWTSVLLCLALAIWSSAAHSLHQLAPMTILELLESPFTRNTIRNRSHCPHVIKTHRTYCFKLTIHHTQLSSKCIDPVFTICFYRAQAIGCFRFVAPRHANDSERK
jgi:hypothetical protein